MVYTHLQDMDLFDLFDWRAIVIDLVGLGILGCMDVYDKEIWEYVSRDQQPFPTTAAERSHWRPNKSFIGFGIMYIALNFLYIIRHSRGDGNFLIFLLVLTQYFNNKRPRLPLTIAEFGGVLADVTTTYLQQYAIFVIYTGFMTFRAQHWLVTQFFVAWLLLGAVAASSIGNMMVLANAFFFHDKFVRHFVWIQSIL